MTRFSRAGNMLTHARTHARTHTENVLAFSSYSFDESCVLPETWEIHVRRARQAGHDNPSLSIGTQLPTWQWQTPGITSEMLHIATGLANQIRFHSLAREDAARIPAHLLPAGLEIRRFASKMSTRVPWKWKGS